jgi:hypothetical protein
LLDQKQWGKMKKILLVDDEADIITLLEATIARNSLSAPPN